ncbi:MAG: hypothetical protein CMJ81_15070 [Planctomycetaceae bacterium]|nr:hypothetical protein [Planctomycetaceae bacterium]MBP62096.1 hypothetical protein [Planctomycetaceae bacterium]
MPEPMSVYTRERWLLIAVRVLGIFELFAIPFIFVPFAWMGEIHEHLGLGSIPEGRIVSYLARSLSGFYAINGVVLLYISFDLKYYWSLLKLFVAIFIVMGFTLTILDLSLGMPFSWTLSEGPVEILFGGLMWWLMKKIDPEDMKKQ